MLGDITVASLFCQIQWKILLARKKIEPSLTTKITRRTRNVSMLNRYLHPGPLYERTKDIAWKPFRVGMGCMDKGDIICPPPI